MAACAKLAFITGRPPFFSHLYNGNDWRPVVDKGIPAFTQKPSLGVGAGVYPPSLASSKSQGQRGARAFFQQFLVVRRKCVCLLAFHIDPCRPPCCFGDARWARSISESVLPKTVK